jgi:hypothetical protein
VHLKRTFLQVQSKIRGDPTLFTEYPGGNPHVLYPPPKVAVPLPPPHPLPLPPKSTYGLDHKGWAACRRLYDDGTMTISETVFCWNQTFIPTSCCPLPTLELNWSKWKWLYRVTLSVWRLCVGSIHLVYFCVFWQNTCTMQPRSASTWQSSVVVAVVHIVVEQARN